MGVLDGCVWGNFQRITNVTIAEDDALTTADVTIAERRELCVTSYLVCHVFWDITKFLSIGCEYGYCIRIVWIIWFGFQHGDTLADMTSSIIMRYACNCKFEAIKPIVILWPDADMIAVVFDAEIL